MTKSVSLLSGPYSYPFIPTPTSIVLLQVECHTWRAICYKAAGQPVDALGELRRVVELAPAEAPAHHQQGELLEQMDRLEEAAAAYRQAVQVESDMLRKQTHISAADNVAARLARRRSAEAELEEAAAKAEAEEQRAQVSILKIVIYWQSDSTQHD
jgi:tetratricopeptide (TPR) repeat protein